MSGIIAIVGRPNVGKSALFNRLIRRRIAIVHNQPGVTRDRVSAETEWHGRPFTLLDTGGIGLLRREKSEDVITRAAFDQVQIAIESAHVIVLVVNVQEGVVPLDREVAARLRLAGKPVLVAVNKVDTDKADVGTAEFAALGFDQLFPVSAIHGEGINDLLDAAVKLLPTEVPAASAEAVTAEGEGAQAAGDVPPGAEEAAPAKIEDRPLKIAIIGRPNVGKSSIINALTHSKRVIVSEVPGTTRDAVDVPFEVETEGVRQRYVLIDTAGLRKFRRVDDSVEFFSVKRTEDSVARCDLVVFVLDAEAGLTEQDKKVGDLIVENRKGCVVVVNKWDLMAESVGKAQLDEANRKLHSKQKSDQLTTLAEFGAWVQEKLFFLDYAPVLFTSAQTGLNLEKLLEAIRYVAAQLQQKIPTGLLNRTLRDAIERRQPVSSAGHRLKFFYATQVRQAPPTILLFVNRRDLLSDQYRKYLSDALRRAFGFEGCPIVLAPKDRTKTIEPARRARPAPASGAGLKGGPASGIRRVRQARIRPTRRPRPAR